MKKKKRKTVLSLNTSELHDMNNTCVIYYLLHINILPNTFLVINLNLNHNYIKQTLL